MKSVVRILDGVRKEKREIVGDGFVDPLIAIAGPSNDVAPPLVSGFVKGNDLREKFLSIGIEAGAPLGFGREERVGGDVKESGPALPKIGGICRDAEVAEREWSRIKLLLVEMDK